MLPHRVAAELTTEPRSNEDLLLGGAGVRGWKRRESKGLLRWLVGEGQQAARYRFCPRGASQRDIPTPQCGIQANIAKPHLREGHEICGDNDINRSRGRFETDLDIIWPQHKPPVAWAAIGLGQAAEIEANDETIGRDPRSVDLPTNAPNQHIRI